MSVAVALSRLRCFSDHTTGFENLAGRLNKAADSAHRMAEMVAGGATIDELESLYRAELSHFVRAAAAIVGDEAAGRDAVQGAFVRAVRKRASFKFDSPLEAWVWRIVINRKKRQDRQIFGRHLHPVCGQGIRGAAEPAVCELPIKPRSSRQEPPRMTAADVLALPYAPMG